MRQKLEKWRKTPAIAVTGLAYLPIKCRVGLNAPEGPTTTPAAIRPRLPR